MYQVLQHQKTGELIVEELPAPPLRPGSILVQNRFSLISVGTERTSVERGQASLLGKARSQPDQVRQVFEMMKREGVLPSVSKILTKLDSYKELGYSTAGVVLESAVEDFRPGDRVACAGATANHAGIVCVPRNLAVRIPDSVGFDEAAFTTLGAIAMQGVRQADVRLGEAVAVIGLGLLGIITVQLLRASGCRVIGLDVDEANFDLARQMGCDACVVSNRDAIKVVESFTQGHGADAIIITAGTSSNEPLELSLHFGRKKAKVVVVGAIGMNVPRSPFYEKEIDLRISCSYGPGRYDFEYEELGIDYPIAWARWTENRNMQAVLELMGSKRLDVASLITHRIPITEALRAYELVTGRVKEHSIGILLQYPDSGPAADPSVRRVGVSMIAKDGPATVGFIGAGSFAQSMLLPPLKALGVTFQGVMTAEPANARSVARRSGFAYAASDADEILRDAAVDAVFVATRHDSHADYVVRALHAGRHVFVEKPLAISMDQLRTVEAAAVASGRVLTVGFNRRFSPSFVAVREHFRDVREPLVIQFRVHAGFIPKGHWVQAPAQGGRIVGEVCHFIDIMQYLTEARPVKVYTESIRTENVQAMNADNVVITVGFSDGSVGTVQYLANGDSAVPKEYCEVYGGGRTAIMDNYRSVKLFSGGRQRSRRFDGRKGHNEEVAQFIKAITGREQPALTLESIVDTTLATLLAVESLATGQPRIIGAVQHE